MTGSASSVAAGLLIPSLHLLLSVARHHNLPAWTGTENDTLENCAMFRPEAQASRLQAALHACEQQSAERKEEWERAVKTTPATTGVCVFGDTGGEEEAQAAYEDAMATLADESAECHRHMQSHTSKKSGRTKWTMMEMWPMQVYQLNQSMFI